MSVELFEQVVSFLIGKGVKSINLTGTGEPLLHPEITKICETLNRVSIPYGVKTNLTKLPPANCNAAWVKVSLDAANAEDYTAIRGTDDFDTVISNIKKVQVGLQCMVQDAESVRKFYDFYRNFDCSYIVFRPIAQVGSSFYPAGERQRIIEAIGECSGKVINNLDKWDFAHPPRPCPMNWLTIYINYKGEVVYCCDKQDEVVGPLNDETFKKQWVTDPATCNLPCRLYHYNNLYYAMEAARDEHTDFV